MIVGRGVKSMRKMAMKKKLPKLTLSKETLRSLSAPQLNQVVGGYSLAGTCDSCNYSCDPNSARHCPITWDCGGTWDCPFTVYNC